MHPIIQQAQKAQLAAVLQLQKECYQSEAALYNDYSIQPLSQTIEELNHDFDNGEICLVAAIGKNIVGAVRGSAQAGTGYIGKLIVAPLFQNQGIGKQLMAHIEKKLDAVDRFELFTGSRSLKNISLYKKLGYQAFDQKIINDALILVYLEKINKKE
ncbi:MAG: GNAT family N-acetyltransferase [Niabella sp.]|nr:GNAT family N-acetyltransferase [Niabella sp.]